MRPLSDRAVGRAKNRRSSPVLRCVKRPICACTTAYYWPAGARHRRRCGSRVDFASPLLRTARKVRRLRQPGLLRASWSASEPENSRRRHLSIRRSVGRRGLEPRTDGLTIYCSAGRPSGPGSGPRAKSHDTALLSRMPMRSPGAIALRPELDGDRPPREGL